MNASGIARRSASASSPPEQAIRSPAAPIYVVCSPNRQVGKTMLARLLAEHHAADERPFEAYDLSDEAPGLADFLSHRVSLPNIRDVHGQVHFFDGLIEPDNIPKIVDLSHREFVNFFSVVDRIGLFEEAQCRAIEPVILFLVDRTQVAADAYALLRRRFVGISLLPVRNQLVARGVPHGGPFPHASTLVVSLELSVLGPAARSFVQKERFSFLRIGEQERPYSEMPDRVHGEIGAWFRRARLQFRELELSLIRQHVVSALHSHL
jgi:hypothetical protein